MLKGKIILIILVTLIFFVFLSVFRWRFSFSWEILFFLAGGVLGMVLLDLDHFLYVFYTRPEEPSSLEASRIFRGKKYREGIIYVLEHAGEKKELVLHSVLFGPVLFILSVFVLTSSGSFFGAGLVLGVYLRYILDLVISYTNNPITFNERFFWQIQGGVDLRTQNISLFLLFLGFIFCSYLFIF